MRKQIISQTPSASASDSQHWLDLEQLSHVELTSEDAAYPIEAALKLDPESGWRASQSGTQTIRLLFDQPQQIRRIYLKFEEKEQTRTQEFLLRCSSDNGKSYREIVRQQYTFSPPGTVQEVEDYTVDLNGVSALELIITPHISGGDVCASLRQLRIA